jgi:hypothetical protein
MRIGIMVAGCLAVFGSFLVRAESGLDPAFPEKAAVASAAQQFGAALKAELLAAMEQGGVTGAVAVCRDRAPAIAREVSVATGWTVRRVSLKPRNPASQPDAWETAMLKTLETQLAGDTPRTLTESAMRFPADVCEGQAADTNEVRYLKYIYIEPVCLACHGTAIDPSVQSAISGSYPGDQATGYAVGQLRGAISVRGPLTAP